MLIDCYGYESSSIYFRNKEKHIHECAKSGSITYLRFSTDEVGPIHKIDETDPADRKIMWAYGAWEDRESLDYKTDKNTPLEVSEVK